MGSLEVGRRLPVRDLGLYGALLDAGEALRPGTSLRGRLTFREVSEDIVACVRHARTELDVDNAARHLVGMAFAEKMTDRMGDVLAHDQLGPTVTVREARDRRRGGRLACSGQAAFELTTAVSVEVRDLSTGGTMFTTGTSLTPGRRGRLRLGLGDQRFAAVIEVLRIDTAGGVGHRPEYRVAAAFTSLDEDSRRLLASFLAGTEG